MKPARQAVRKDIKMPSRALTASALLIFATNPLAAGELCVICTGPPASYRCDSATSAATGAGFQLLCVKQIATRGGHESCTVDRTRSNAPCNGVLVTLDQPPQGAPLPSAPAAPASADPVAPTPVIAQPSNAPPATMEALAKETAEQSKKEWDATNAKVQETTQAAGQNLKNAGGAVGDAVKKSWNCMISLFSSC